MGAAWIEDTFPKQTAAKEMENNKLDAFKKGSLLLKY